MLTILAVATNVLAVFFATVAGYGMAVDSKSTTSYYCLSISFALAIAAMMIIKYSGAI